MLAKWTAGRASRFRIPGLELTGGSAKPQQNAVFLLTPCFRCQGGHGKEALEAQQRRRTGGQCALQE